MKVYGLQMVKRVAQFGPVGPDVLERGSAHCAGNKREVLNAAQALVEGVFDEAVPTLAGPGPHQGGLGFAVFAANFQPANLIFQHHAGEILGKKQVGAAAKNELVGSLHLGQLQQLAQRIGRGKSGEIAGLHIEAKGIVGAEGDVFFERRHHARKGRGGM